MKKYSVRNKNSRLITNVWFSDFADDTYYEPNFGSPDDYTLEIEDLTLSESQINDNKWLDLRNKRNQLLSICDWTQLADAPLNAENKQAWRTYRKALRDLPGTISNIAEQEPVWPVSPDEA